MPIEPDNALGDALEFAAEVLCGTLYYRHLLSTRPVDENAVDNLLDMFIAAYSTTR